MMVRYEGSDLSKMEGVVLKVTPKAGRFAGRAMRQAAGKHIR